VAMVDLIDEAYHEDTNSDHSEEVCVIGAGASGIAMCRALAAREITFVCHERGSAVGGLWRYPSPGRGSGAYGSLFTNTSRSVMQFPSFPIPEEYPLYLHHSLIAQYFEDYVDHYGLRSHIHCNSEVSFVSQRRDGRWDVVLADGTLGRFRTVVVASGGRHAEPAYPELTGSFAGRELHVYDYDGPEAFAGQRVVVVGLGASGADIACDLSGVAAKTYLAARTGHYVVPKLLRGHAIDVLSPLTRRLSVEARGPLLALMLKLVNGDMTAYGLPKPPYPPGRGPLIASNELLPAIAHGRITPTSSLVSRDGHTVGFADGSEREADAIVYCTGYHVGFPFLDSALGMDGKGSPPLYHLVVPPELGGLYFIGLLHSMMSLPPLAEAQSEWVGDLLTGEVALPSRGEMWRTIRAARRRQDKRFYDTSEYLLVDPNEYERLIQRERQARSLSRQTTNAV
jgi:dimethylaniline monooxygenase (N-oxide forming)